MAVRRTDRGSAEGASNELVKREKIGSLGVPNMVRAAKSNRKLEAESALFLVWRLGAELRSWPGDAPRSVLYGGRLEILSLAGLQLPPEIITFSYSNREC